MVRRDAVQTYFQNPSQVRNGGAKYCKNSKIAMAKTRRSKQRRNRFARTAEMVKSGQKEQRGTACAQKNPFYVTTATPGQDQNMLSTPPMGDMQSSKSSTIQPTKISTSSLSTPEKGRHIGDANKNGFPLRTSSPPQAQI